MNATAEHCRASHRYRSSLPISPYVVAGITKLIDFGIIVGAALASFVVYLVSTRGSRVDLDRYSLTALLGAAAFAVGLQHIGGYEFKNLSRMHWQATRVGVVWAGAVSVLLLIAFLTKTSDTYSRGWALLWATIAFALLLFERSVLCLAIDRWTRQGRLVRNIVIVGAGDAGEQLIAKLQRLREGSIAIVGVFDDRKTRIAPTVAGFDVIGTTDDLLQFARQIPIDEIIVALPLSAEQRLKAIFDKLRRLPVDLRLSAEPIADAFPVRGIDYLGDVPMLEVVEKPLKHWSAVAKWIEDKALATILLALISPAMALIALAIKLDSRGPIFFVQERLGFNNKIIRVLKFRTMHHHLRDANAERLATRNDPRVTRVGAFLRRTSLDELPQLINVLRGEMSIVGPRPHALMAKAADHLYHDAVAEYAVRHRVKPGITGWAQVKGWRGETDTVEKIRRRVEHDLEYIDNWSIWLDLKIILLSFRVLFARENAY